MSTVDTSDAAVEWHARAHEVGAGANNGTAALLRALLRERDEAREALRAAEAEIERLKTDLYWDPIEKAERDTGEA